ncbi:MAG: bifunctional hydroxymethylpyrimidine kinase/phosphomethylpyrimidine kinase [Acidobacteriota bacterium]|nr:bifunctional hydroxymethylpyrimidine kinase/phosphomethylpyrimidine kinase [Acidobacteriota bacterium]
MKKVLLTPAGFDPPSGAGLSLDLKVFSHFGCYGLAIPTSITVQNSFNVYDYKMLPTSLITGSYHCLKMDFKISGIKIGMIGGKKAIPAIKAILADNQQLPVVADPVFRSSSGRWLLDKDDLKATLKF